MIGNPVNRPPQFPIRIPLRADEAVHPVGDLLMPKLPARHGGLHGLKLGDERLGLGQVRLDALLQLRLEIRGVDGRDHLAFDTRTVSRNAMISQVIPAALQTQHVPLP